MRFMPPDLQTICRPKMRKASLTKPIPPMQQSCSFQQTCATPPCFNGIALMWFNILRFNYFLDFCPQISQNPAAWNLPGEQTKSPIFGNRLKCASTNPILQHTLLGSWKRSGSPYLLVNVCFWLEVLACHFHSHECQMKGISWQIDRQVTMLFYWLTDRWPCCFIGCSCTV